MKNAKRKAAAEPPAVHPAPARRWKVWHLILLFFFAVLVTVEVYQPALEGPFVFDDEYLPFQLPEYEKAPFKAWVAGLRPILMASFWLNYRMEGLDPYGYHLLNVLLHFANAIFVLLIARRLLEWAGAAGWRRQTAAAFAGGLFLLHPLQTEAVAYVASRSETLSVFFYYAAFAVFLYRRSAEIRLARSGAVIVLFAGAAMTKEHTVTLPVLLLLTDYFWSQPRFSWRGIGRNWRLYAPLTTVAAAGAAFVWSVLSQADTAGFSMKDLPWHDYFLTQCRAIWVYIRLFVLPYGQNADHLFPISRGLLDHGAVAGLIALAAVAGAAVRYHRRYPLICYGTLVFLLLLAPTSSVIPIKDALAERRFYLPSIGLLLAAADLVRRWKVKAAPLAAAMAGTLVILGVLSYQRNRVWNSPTALWEDAVAKSPKNSRAHFQLAFAYYRLQRCDDSLRHYELASRLQAPSYRLLVDWSLASACAGRHADALAQLERARQLENTGHVHALIGLVHSMQSRRDEALAALERAEQLDPNFAMTYVYRGNVFAAAGEWHRAIEQYRRTLAIEPGNQAASLALQDAMQRIRRTAGR